MIEIKAEHQHEYIDIKIGELNRELGTVECSMISSYGPCFENKFPADETMPEEWAQACALRWFKGELIRVHIFRGLQAKTTTGPGVLLKLAEGFEEKIEETKAMYLAYGLSA